MALIAVINSKGGAGKSTVSSHIAAYCAMRNPDVTLCDLDPQGSSAHWLEQRPAGAPRIRGYRSPGSFTHPPAGSGHVIIDTPSGFEGLPFLRVMMYADAVIVPTAFSFFDRRALESTIRALKAAPRVAKGNCVIGCIGTRMDPRSNDPELLETMLRDLGVSYIGSIPAARTYSRCLEQGLTVFDFPSAVARSQATHWAATVGWLETVLAKAPARAEIRAVVSRRPVASPAPPGPRETARPSSLAATLMRNIPRFLVR